MLLHAVLFALLLSIDVSLGSASSSSLPISSSGRRSHGRDYVSNTQPGLFKDIASIQLGLHIRRLRGVILLVADSNRQDHLLIRKSSFEKIKILYNRKSFSMDSNVIRKQCGCDYKCAEDSVFYMELKFLDEDPLQPFSLHCGQSSMKYGSTYGKETNLEPRGDWLPRLDKNDGNRTVILVGNRGPYPSSLACTSCREKTSMDGCLVFFQVTHKDQRPSSNATTSDLVFKSHKGGGSLKPHCRGDNSGCAHLEWREGRPHCLSHTTTTTATTSSITTVVTEELHMLVNSSLMLTPTDTGRISLGLTWTDAAARPLCLLQITCEKRQLLLQVVNNHLRMLSMTEFRPNHTCNLARLTVNATRHHLKVVLNLGKFSFKVNNASTNHCTEAIHDTVRSILIGYTNSNHTRWQCDPLREKFGLTFEGLSWRPTSDPVEELDDSDEITVSKTKGGSTEIFVIVGSSLAGFVIFTALLITICLLRSEGARQAPGDGPTNQPTNKVQETLDDNMEMKICEEEAIGQSESPRSSSGSGGEMERFGGHESDDEDHSTTHDR